ncbi:MAG: hypothetical protein AAFP76_05160 [Bacteroidota bacterium]
MQTKMMYLSDLKFNLETWRRELRFHFDEMDHFEEKLEDISRTEFGKDARIGLEQFHNRIMIEKATIAKLKHRCKHKLRNLQAVDFAEEIDGRLRNEQSSLRDDMRTYIKMHYDLKEEMMEYFLEYLPQ